MSSKNVPLVQYNIPGVFQVKVRQIHVRAQIWFILFMALFTVTNFQLILNQISPPGNPHWHWQHCEPDPVCLYVLFCFFHSRFSDLLLFWKGICKVLRCNGLKILVPKHPWKSKIGSLQLILLTKCYVSFFLGHPVYMLFIPNSHFWWKTCKKSVV